jgi:hypothetical protein
VKGEVLHRTTAHNYTRHPRCPESRPWPEIVRFQPERFAVRTKKAKWFQRLDAGIKLIPS